MQRRHIYRWMVIALILLIAGCGGGADERTPTEPPTAFPSPPPGPNPTTSPTLEFPPNLFLQPSVLNIAVGEMETAHIWIDGARGLNGITVELGFDPQIVEVVDADPEAEGVQIIPGEVPQPVQILENQAVVAEGAGRIRYQVALALDEVVNGGGIVLSVTFRGLTEGGSPIRFEDVAAFGPEGEPLELMPLSDGLVTVGGEPAQPTAPPPDQPSPQPTGLPTSPPTGEGGIYYVVQPGENLFRIGLKFGTTGQAIAAANNIADPTQVPSGAMILVPVSPPSGQYGYYVQPGDTLYSIARRFGMGVEELAALNGIGADYAISVGEILTVTP